MFNACRRGPASLSRVLRATASTTRIPSTRPLTLSLSLQRSTASVLEPRWLHVSSQLRNQNVAARLSDQLADEVDDINGQHSSATITRFDQLQEYNLVHPNVVRAITKGMGHQTMTEVQTATINQALHGTDIIAQARTGTGKTLGFLVPTIQNIISKNPDLALQQQQQRYSSRARSLDIRAIIISPTRELAEQIAVEAVKLTKYTDLIVQVAVGGNSKRFMLQKTQREGCHILVATPGRLNDLLTDKYSKIAAPKLTTLVLDEADRLLDDGFARDIEAIIDLLPDRRLVDRQTLLFSATVPREVMGLVRSTLKPDFSFVQTVKEGDVATHESVPQKIVIVPGLENFMPTLLELSKRETEKVAKAGPDGNPFKAIVYFSSTANVELAASIFENLRGEGGDMFSRHPLYPAQIFEMHGKLTQAERTRTSDRFRKSKSAILFSSDVTARGMDFPGVTHVIQIGLPPNRDQYIHRIGRTGRAGRIGEGWTFITQGELQEARSLLRGLPISPDKTLEASQVDMTRDAQLPASLAKTLSQAGDATKMVSRSTKVKAYLAQVSQLRSNPRIGAAELNQWTRYGWGWEQPPAIDARLAQKKGLSRVEGMNIGRERDWDDDLSESEDRGFGARGSEGFSDRGGFGGRDRGRSGRFGGSGRGGGFGRSDYNGSRNGRGRSREPLASF